MSEEEKNKQFKEDLLNVTGNFLKTGLDCIEKQKNELEQLQQENQNLKQINEEHRKLNGELIEENKKLKEKLQNNSKINIADHKYASEMEDKYLEFQQENEFYKHVIKDNYDTSQDIMYEMKEENIKLQQENKELKERLDYEIQNHIMSDKNYCEIISNHKNILTEFEKWLEEKINNANKILEDKELDEDTKGYVLTRKYMLEECLDKLQELKEGKK